MLGQWIIKDSIILMQRRKAGVFSLAIGPRLADPTLLLGVCLGSTLDCMDEDFFEVLEREGRDVIWHGLMQVVCPQLAQQRMTPCWQQQMLWSNSISLSGSLLGHVENQ